MEYPESETEPRVFTQLDMFADPETVGDERRSIETFRGVVREESVPVSVRVQIDSAELERDPQAVVRALKMAQLQVLEGQV